MYVLITHLYIYIYIKEKIVIIKEKTILRLKLI